MKKFLTALTIILLLTAQVEAAPFTREQMDKIFIDVEQMPESDLTFGLNVETLKEKFNGIVTPILKETMGTDDVSEMAHLFLIKEYKVFSKPDGDTFANVFGDYRVALVGTCAANGGNFKTLSLYYTTPEGNDESIFTIWLLTAFVKSISPEVDVQNLMNELTTEGASGTAIKDGVKFSIAEDGNLNFLTATPIQ
ncbi:MAG: hypothetical protein IKT98_01415 [Selenomonadaceae bacterium]|nr:hypothetical protein [Selenomonadaceae bacterium]